MTPKEIRLMQKFGIVFQNPVLFEWRTVKKNIELPLEIMGYSKKETACCAVEKDGGDDIDATHGALIEARVELSLIHI